MIRARDIIARRQQGRENTRNQVIKLAAPPPSAGPGPMDRGLPGPPGPQGPPPGPGMEEPTPEPGLEEGGGGDQNVAEMVKYISHEYLGDEVLQEIQEAVMELIGRVTPEVSKDVAKDFGKFMEAAAILKANLNALLVMATPPKNLQQLQLYPEEEQSGLKSDILT